MFDDLLASLQDQAIDFLATDVNRGYCLVTLGRTGHQIYRTHWQGLWRSSRLSLLFRLGTELGIMAFLVVVIACDLGSISPGGTIPTSLFWDFLLGFSGLGSVGL